MFYSVSGFLSREETSVLSVKDSVYACDARALPRGVQHQLEVVEEIIKPLLPTQTSQIVFPSQDTRCWHDKKNVQLGTGDRLQRVHECF